MFCSNSSQSHQDQAIWGQQGLCTQGEGRDYHLVCFTCHTEWHLHPCWPLCFLVQNASDLGVQNTDAICETFESQVREEMRHQVIWVHVEGIRLFEGDLGDLGRKGQWQVELGECSWSCCEMHWEHSSQQCHLSYRVAD